MLDLDTEISLKNFVYTCETLTSSEKIRRIIHVLKDKTTSVGVLNKYYGEIMQYSIEIKYLNIVLRMYFEFDYTNQFINIIYYDNTLTKTLLKLSLEINDEPFIKYIENDKTIVMPRFKNEFIELKPGEYLMNLSHRILKFLCVSRVRLDDDSCLIQKDNLGETIICKLWLYYLVTHGKSWYDKFGYQPANTNVNEYYYRINKVNSINLSQINECLKLIIDDGENLANTRYAEVSRRIVEIIGDFDGNLETFAKTKSIIQFANLTNNLSQSIFSGKLLMPNSTKVIEFDWYDKIMQLHMSNIAQVNNNITYYKLSN